MNGRRNIRSVTAVLAVLFVIVFIALLASGCKEEGGAGGDSLQTSAAAFVKQQETASSYNGQEILPAVQDRPVDSGAVNPYTAEAELLAVGDIMMHMPQIQAGYDVTSDTYSYDHFFAPVRHILAEGDWVIANLETTLAGAERKYSGYPLFNAPDELADALKNAGFNIITTANNHSLDRHEQGVLRTLKTLKSRGLIPVGTHASRKEADEITIVSKRGINMAVLAYTYGTNGIPIPRGKEYLVNLLDVEKIAKDIRKAREKGADIVTVALHMGPREYHRQPDASQRQIVSAVIDAGADIILGGHPHVVQPYFLFAKKADGHGGQEKKGAGIYSLGNFISAQVNDYKDYGVIFKVTVKKHFPSGVTEIAEVETIPTYVHRYAHNGRKNYRVLPLEEVLKERSDPLLSEQDYAVFAGKLEEMDRHLQSLLVPADTLPRR